MWEGARGALATMGSGCAAAQRRKLTTLTNCDHEPTTLRAFFTCGGGGGDAAVAACAAR